MADRPVNMTQRRQNAVILIAGAVLALTVGCSTAGEPSTPAPSSAAPSSAAEVGTAKITARGVVDAFKAAGLPVPEARDNSKNCQRLGCKELVTTEAISVYVWPDEASAKHQAEVSPDQTHRRGVVVLSYAAARTPEKDRPRYEAELAKLL